MKRNTNFKLFFPNGAGFLGVYGLKILPINGYLSLVFEQNYFIFLIFFILHLEEPQTTFFCLIPKINPPYYTVYSIKSEAFDT